MKFEQPPSPDALTGVEHYIDYKTSPEQVANNEGLNLAELIEARSRLEKEIAWYAKNDPKSEAMAGKATLIARLKTAEKKIFTDRQDAWRKNMRHLTQEKAWKTGPDFDTEFSNIPAYEAVRNHGKGKPLSVLEAKAEAYEKEPVPTVPGWEDEPARRKAHIRKLDTEDAESAFKVTARHTSDPATGRDTLDIPVSLAEAEKYERDPIPSVSQGFAPPARKPVSGSIAKFFNLFTRRS